VYMFVASRHGCPVNRYSNAGVLRKVCLTYTHATTWDLACRSNNPKPPSLLISDLELAAASFASQLQPSARQLTADL
jgi:hypothetical protein